MPTPRVINALNEVINAKGLIMDIALKRVPHITFKEALPHFTWYRFHYVFCAECLEMARKQADILQQIIAGVPCFYVKKCQGEVNYHPIFKYVWDETTGHYICHRRVYHFEEHEKVYEWKQGGMANMEFLIEQLNSYVYLASLTPMTNSAIYNLE